MPMSETAICIDNPAFPYVLGILQMPEAEFHWTSSSEEDEAMFPLTGMQW